MASVAALGLRLHSGWASAVVMAQDGVRGPAPRLIVRRRVMLCELPRAKQPYHAAEDMELKKAEVFIAECREATIALAEKTLAQLKHEAGPCALKGVGLAASSAREGPPLCDILRSHALIHAAEGVFYRSALIEAANHLGMRTHAVSNRAASDFLEQAGELRKALERIGKAAGPPWTSDEKCASLAALIFLRGLARRFHLARLAAQVC